ncbi:hypothetical protein BDN71DRAFT_1593580 [Pleurotus eryngii]|uniref:Uncharacterized protein n=1 Tax=Pleurotus eryngii TaxID=5323 RepID=A0A9P5ZMY9_PLEER|nr:hypothetical protein BDN71DRAFT_1593580 [Pleurotus eryngii]
MSMTRNKTAAPYQNREALDQLATTMGEYDFLLNKHTAGAPPSLPNFHKIYTLGSQGFVDIAPPFPYMGSDDYPAKKAEYLAFCDFYCKSETPADPVRSVMAVQAANYAKQIYNQEFLLLNQEERSYVHENICKYYCARFSSIRQDRPILSWHTCTCPTDVLPYELMSSIQYHTDSDGIQQCTILDYGTSKALGDWVKVEHGNGRVEQLTKEDMLLLLKKTISVSKL